jgi:type II secretory pathway component PulF
MIKTAEMTGDLSTVLDDMAEYYTSIDRTRKQVVSAMTYPIIIFIFAIAVTTFILLYIIPTLLNCLKKIMQQFQP